jgi:hypothetical protein
MYYEMEMTRHKVLIACLKSNGHIYFKKLRESKESPDSYYTSEDLKKYFLGESQLMVIPCHISVINQFV